MHGRDEKSIQYSGLNSEWKRPL